MKAKTQYLQKSLAEFIGTFALVFFGCGSIMIEAKFPGTIPAGGIPVIFGTIVATMIYTVGHISGAHFNPAVTLAFTVTRHFPVKQLPYYFVAQFIGAISAIALLSFLIPDSNIFGATIPTINIVSAFIWEVVLSFFLMFVIIAVATDTRAVGVMAGIAIGTIVMLCAFIGGKFTGASMNPARSLAPAIFQGTLSDIWLYIIAPCVGTLLGALTYQKIRCEPSTTNAEGCC
jgi:MIP family channel proteins